MLCWYPNVVGTQHHFHIKINCSAGFHLYFQTQKRVKTSSSFGLMMMGLIIFEDK